MSGFCFFPGWVRHGVNFGMFTDETMQQAEEAYIRTIAAAVGDSPRFLGFDLGNELSCVTGHAPGLTMEQADAWQERMLRCCMAAVPGKLHNNGVDHQPWMGSRHFSRTSLAAAAPIIPLHCWTKFTGAHAHGGLLGTASIHIAPYMAELAKAYSPAADKPVWIQEIGCSPLWTDGDAQDMTAFALRTLAAAADVPGLWGLTWWCSHDLPASLTGYEPLEYALGLLDTANRPKPYALEMRKWIAAYRARPAVPAVRDTAYIYDPACEQADLFAGAAQYMRYVEAGCRPAIVLRGRETDTAHLRSRGIKTIL